MAINWIPELQMLAYPLQAQQITRYSGFALADDLSLLQKQGDPVPQGGLPPVRLSTGIILQSPPIAVQKGYVENVEGLRWWNLADEQDGTRLRGYTLTPHLVYVNNLIDYSCAPDPAYAAIRWMSLDGNPAMWSTCMPDHEPGTTALAWHSADPEEPFAAATQLPLPPNQSFAVQVEVLGTEHRAWSQRDPGLPYPYLRVVWGGGYALRLSPGQVPVVERDTARDGWKTLRQAEDFGQTQAAQGPVEISVLSFAGRLVLEFSGSEHATNLVYTRRQPAQENATAGDLQPVTWPQQRLKVEGIGLPFTLRLAEVQWGTRDEKTGQIRPEGSFQRQYNCNRRILMDDPPQAFAFGYYANGKQTRQLGQKGPDPADLASITDTAVYDKAGRFLGERRYTCTLKGQNPAYRTGDADDNDLYQYVPGPEDEEQWAGGVRERREACMAGSSTPFVHSVALRLSHETQTDDRSPIDLRPAITRAAETLADPALQPGSRWTVDIDRILLPECPVTETGKPVGNNWRQYVAEYHPCRVRAWWTRTDGKPSDPVETLSGLIWAVSPALPRYGERPTQIELRDWAVRLQKPAGVVDGRFAPLDLIAAEKARQDEEFYGWHGVQYILGEVLGPEVGEALRVYFPAGHYPLLKYMLLFSPPNGSGFMLRPPFGDSALNWIKQLCDVDVAVFYFGQVMEDGEVKVAPIYGNYFEIMRGAPVIDLPDAVYVTEDVDKVASEFRLRGEPEVDYNRVLVLGHLPLGGDDTGGLMPALPAFSREARIETGSPLPEQNIQDTWERTWYVEGKQFFLRNVAGAVASALASWLKGRRARHFGIVCRGLPAISWGWKVRVKASSSYSDQTLDMDGKVFRVMRVENTWDLGKAASWTTRLAVVDEPAGVT